MPNFTFTDDADLCYSGRCRPLLSRAMSISAFTRDADPALSRKMPIEMALLLFRIVVDDAKTTRFGPPGQFSLRERDFDFCFAKGSRNGFDSITDHQ